MKCTSVYEYFLGNRDISFGQQEIVLSNPRSSKVDEKIRQIIDSLLMKNFSILSSSKATAATKEMDEKQDVVCGRIGKFCK
jgi:hypothetical protein